MTAGAYAGKPTICLHTGMTDAYVWDLESAEPRIADRAETRQILQEIDATFRQKIQHLIYSHKVSHCTLICHWSMFAGKMFDMLDDSVLCC